MLKFLVFFVLLFNVLAYHSVFAQNIKKEEDKTQKSVSQSLQVENDLILIIKKNFQKSLDYFVQGVSKDLKNYFTKKYENFLSTVSDSSFRLNSYLKDIFQKSLIFF